MNLAKYLAVAIFLLLPASAQEVTGSIVGSVVDSSGAPVPETKIRVHGTDRNLDVRTVTTDKDGEFAATLLPIGLYELHVEKPGFQTIVRGGIELHVNDRITVHLELKVGQASTQVTVEATQIGVELQSPVAAGLISGDEIRELSLNNRNYAQLLTLMPGVTSNSPTDELYIGTTNPLGSTNSVPFSVNGGRTSGNSFMVDGADNVDRGSNVTLLNYPSVDAIAEVKVLRAQYSAEYGRGAAGQVNVVMASGKSRFHGSAYEFNRNDAYSANNFFNNARRIPIPPLRYNNFGYTVSGPIPWLGNRKGDSNKTFFFWSQEFRRVITYGTFQATVPTEDLKQGNFSSPVCVEATGNTCTATATQIRNINPVAAAYIKDIWSKVPAGDPGTFNLFTPQRSNYNHRQEIIKIDHVFNPGHTIFARYIHDAVPTVEPGGLFTGAVIPGVAITKTDSPGKGWTFRDTIASPSWLNEAGYSFSYGAIVSRPIGTISSELSPDVKVPLPFTPTLSRVPGLSISGVSSVTSFGPYDDFNRNHNIFDNVTRPQGQHTIKFGGTVNIYSKTENAGGNNVGSFAFASTPRPAGTSTLLQGWANFLLGNVSTFTQASQDLTPYIHQRQFELYAQDEYRVRPNLTLDAGVRYSHFWQPFDSNNLLTNFDPALWDPAKAPQVNPANGNIVPGTGDPLNGIIINNQNSPFGSKVSNEDLNRFAPRIGFAWDPFRKQKTSIRSGYGISYDSTLVGIYEQNSFANPPYVNNVTISNTRLENPAAGVQVISAAPKTLHGTPIPAKLPYTQQWSFDINQQIGKMAVTVGYYGSKSTHLLGIVDLNMVPPGAALAAGIVTGTVTSATTPLLNAVRPYRGYAAINTLENWFNSNYNSLQASAQQRLNTSSSLRYSYTWSKVLTNAGSDRNNAPQNTYDRKADYARAPFDRAHVFTASYIYRLPFFAGSRGLECAVLSGWQLSGIVTFNSGLATRVTSGLGLDWAGLGILGTSAASPRPDLISDPNANAPHSIQKWFNTEAFTAVPAGQVRPGNAAATTIIGPGAERWDSSLFKNFTIAERFKVQFRAEAFNVLNHSNFLGISTSLGATNFGQVTSTREARRIQLGLKLNF